MKGTGRKRIQFNPRLVRERGIFLFYYVKPIDEKELCSADEQGDSGHHRVAERGAKGNHDEPDAYAGGKSQYSFVLFGEVEVDQGGDHAHDYDQPGEIQRHGEGAAQLRKHQSVQLLSQDDAGGVTYHKSQRDTRKPGDFGDEPGEHQDSKYRGDDEQQLVLSEKGSDELLPYDGMPNQPYVVSGRQPGEYVLGEFIEWVVLIEKAVYAQGKKGGDGNSDEF
jgi:hypothetical protein